MGGRPGDHHRAPSSTPAFAPWDLFVWNPAAYTTCADYLSTSDLGGTLDTSLTFEFTIAAVGEYNLCTKQGSRVGATLHTSS